MNVSLVIPAYNNAYYLHDSIVSALAQKNINFTEIIIVDDASHDSPEKILADYGPVVKLVRHAANLGVSAARNTGVSNANGDYITFLDADDILDPEYLAKMVNFVEEHELLCAGTWLYYMTNPQNKGKLIKTSPSIGEEPCFPGTFPSGFLIKKSLYDQLNGFSTCLSTAEDTEFFFRIFKAGIPIYHIPQPLVGYRINLTSVTTAGKEKKVFFTDLIRLIFLNNINIPLDEFENIYDMRSQGLLCPKKYTKNILFQRIYRKVYPWRELTALRRLYALWLERKYLKCLIGISGFVLKYPSYTMNMIRELLRRK